jgi:hypothetical protein
MVHSNHTHTSHGSNHGICCIPALLQQVGPNATANVALRGDGAQVTWLERRRSSILRTRNGSLQRQEPCESLDQAGRHDSRGDVEREER